MACIFFLYHSSWGADEENKFTFGFASGFGISAQFNNPALPSPTPISGPSTTSGWDSGLSDPSRYDGYQDGYVDQGGTTGRSWFDSTGVKEFHGTWDWGYDAASQYSDSEGTIAFTRESLILDKSNTQRGRAGFSPGIHFGYRRELRSDDDISLGFSASFEYHRLDIETEATLEAQYVQQRHHYPLISKTSVPAAGYRGSIGGLEIANLYSRTEYLTGDSTAFRENSFNANLFVIRAGMDVQYHLERNMDLIIGIGVLYAPILYDYDFKDSLQVAPNSPITVFQTGSVSEFDGIFGAFVQMVWEFNITENIRGYLGVRHFHMDKVKFEFEEDRWVELNFRNSLFVDTGITYLF